MVDFTIASAWYDPAVLASVSVQLARERVVRLSGFLAEPPGQLPPAKHLEREERPGFAVRATGPALLAELWCSPPLTRTRPCAEEGLSSCVKRVSQSARGCLKTRRVGRWLRSFTGASSGGRW